MVNILDTNFDRSQAVAKRDVERARQAIADISAIRAAKMWPQDVVMRQRYLQVLRLRMGNPDLTLGQLAYRMKVSKATYAARLRRAFGYAERVKRTYGQLAED